MEPQEKPQKPNHHDDGRLSTIYEESEADLESHVMEVRHAELQNEKGLLEATPPDDLFHNTRTDGSRPNCADHCS
eukprot:6987896-Pyramimonas_sp.AAC.1